MICVDSNLLFYFIPLDEILDGDLEAISPSQYMSVSKGIVHTLSYQQARNRALPCRGVVVASSGYMLDSAGGSIIRAVGQKETPTLETFEEAITFFAGPLFAYLGASYLLRRRSCIIS